MQLHFDTLTDFLVVLDQGTAQIQDYGWTWPAKGTKSVVEEVKYVGEKTGGDYGSSGQGKCQTRKRPGGKRG